MVLLGYCGNRVCLPALVVQNSTTESLQLRHRASIYIFRNQRLHLYWIKSLMATCKCVSESKSLLLECWHWTGKPHLCHFLLLQLNCLITPHPYKAAYNQQGHIPCHKAFGCHMTSPLAHISGISHRSLDFSGTLLVSCGLWEIEMWYFCFFPFKRVNSMWSLAL